MITFPPEFVATRFPGYFWNTKTRTLFTLKVTGVLREMRRPRPSIYNHYKNGYPISVNGTRRWLLLSDLMNLPSQEVPYEQPSVRTYLPRSTLA